MHILSHTPITEHHFLNRHFYLKRDDLLHPQFSGNKARKFMSLLDAPLPDIHTLISYGSPQANSLYSLAALAYMRGWQLEFYVDHIPSWLQAHPLGNYKAALALGASIIPTHHAHPKARHPEQYIHTIRCPDNQCLVIPEGGRSELAEPGVTQLGEELYQWIQNHDIDSPVIALPSGTGTTALYLHNKLKPLGIPVITCACVGGENYLIKQFQSLHATNYPTILSLKNKHHFGKLYPEDYQIWQQLCTETHVEFDLLYDPLMWQCLAQWLPAHQDINLIYIHQGGQLGNESMRRRYQRKLYDISPL